MRNVWLIRVLGLAGFVGVAEAIMVIAGMGPRLVPVAAVALVAACVGWLAVDLGAAVEPAAWNSRTRRPAAQAAADSRTRLMRSRLARTTSDEYTLQFLHASLVGLVDDRLLAEHLIDRNEDPDGAREILGAELARFVNVAPSPAALSEPGELARIVTLIENV